MAVNDLSKEAKELLFNELCEKRIPKMVHIPLGYPKQRVCPVCRRAVKFHYQSPSLQRETNRTKYCPFCGQALMFSAEDYFDGIELKTHCINFKPSDDDRPKPECRVLDGPVNCHGCTFYKGPEQVEDDAFMKDLIERMA